MMSNMERIARFKYPKHERKSIKLHTHACTHFTSRHAP